jgi:nitrogen regulatory protein PII
MDISGAKLITCIVQRGKADKVVDAAMAAGAEGATISYGRGTGIRQKLGLKGYLIKPEKEIILIVTMPDQTAAVMEAVVEAARLREKGQGFAFLHEIDTAIGFLSKD